MILVCREGTLKCICEISVGTQSIELHKRNYRRSVWFCKFSDRRTAGGCSRVEDKGFVGNRQRKIKN